MVPQTYHIKDIFGFDCDDFLQISIFKIKLSSFIAISGEGIPGDIAFILDREVASAELFGILSVKLFRIFSRRATPLF